MASTGRGRALPHGASGLLNLLAPGTTTATVDSPLSGALSAFVWGGESAPDPVEIPYEWLRVPLKFRPDLPINSAVVTGIEGDVEALDEDSIERLGQWPSSETIDSVVAADATNLARHLVTYYADPRMRCARVEINILKLREESGDAGIHRVLSRRVGDRIRITGAPSGTPEGATEVVIEGIEHTIGHGDRIVVWMLSPVIGVAPGVAGPWLRTSTGPSPVILEQTFAATLPSGWTISTSAGTGWVFTDPGTRNNRTTTRVATTVAANPFAIVDSDTSGVVEDSSLITPSVDLTDTIRPVVTFNSDFFIFATDVAYVDVSTAGSGGPWTTIEQWDASNTVAGQGRPGPRFERVDLSLFAGASAVWIRFRYTGDFDYWWAIDNVRVFDEASGLLAF